MSRLPIALAFAAGLACATLLGAAAPRVAKPIAWEYRLVDAAVVGAAIDAAVESRTAATRSKFASDDAARAAASVEAWRAWSADLAADGWTCIGRTLLETGERLVTVRPRGVAVVMPRADFSPAAIVAGLAEHDAKWRRRMAKELDLPFAQVTLAGDDYRNARLAAHLGLIEAEMNRCGADGSLLLPVDDLGDTTDRWMPVAFEH